MSWIANNFNELQTAVSHNLDFIEVTEKFYFECLGNVPPIFVQHGLWKMSEPFNSILNWYFYEKDEKYYGCLCTEFYAVKRYKEKN